MIKHYILIAGIYDSGECFSLVLKLLWEQLVFLVLDNNNVGKPSLVQEYDITVLPLFNYIIICEGLPEIWCIPIIGHFDHADRRWGGGLTCLIIPHKSGKHV